MKKTLLLLVASIPCVAMASHWVSQSKIQLSDALAVGHAQDGNPYYLCQSDIDGGVQPGKTWGNYHMCNVPFGGREVPIHQGYDIAVMHHGHWHHRHHHDSH